MLLAKYKAEMMIKSERQSNDTVCKTPFLFIICLFTEMPHRLVDIEPSLVKKYSVIETAVFDRKS